MKCFAKAVVIFAVFFTVKAGVEEDLKLILYSQNVRNGKAYSVSNFQTILSDPNFDQTKKTVFFFYGFSQTENTEKVKTLKNAYVDNGGYNFIISSIGVLSYNVINAKDISNAVVKSINTLVTSGYSLSKIEIVGFSLGAQIGAITARNIPNFSRLTGLDPGQVSSIPFVDLEIEKTINPNDAQFVLTIHTETRSFGDANSLGHLNAWFNNAYRQPMCLILSIEDRACSHTQALLFWAEAVKSNSSTVFPARKCNSYKEFETKTCDANEPIVYINLYTPTTLRGNYYVNTLKTSPYSKTTADP